MINRREFLTLAASGAITMFGSTIFPFQTHLHAYVDEGWKDTVILMPGERVKLHVRFGDNPGLFLYHCHNLEHGDAGMMRNFLISGNPDSTTGMSAT